MGSKVGFFIPQLPPPEVSPNARVHWQVRANATRDYKAMVTLLAKEAISNTKFEYPFENAVIGFVFAVPDKRRRDLDNAISSSKAIIDAIVSAGIIVDDSWQHLALGSIQMRQLKSPGVFVEILKIPFVQITNGRFAPITDTFCT